MVDTVASRGRKGEGGREGGGGEGAQIIIRRAGARARGSRRSNHAAIEQPLDQTGPGAVVDVANR